jgi:3-oxoacyl-[acyl-carrier protein] reductase
MFDLTGKCALITGATGGIGGAIAKALYAQGAKVTLSGTRQAVLEELAASLGERAFVVTAKLSNMEEVEALVPAAEKLMGGLDILVNNAGITKDNLFIRMKDEEWDDVLAVNLTANFRLARAAAKIMMKKRYGRITLGKAIMPLQKQASRACLKPWRRKLPHAMSQSIASPQVLLKPR